MVSPIFLYSVPKFSLSQIFLQLKKQLFSFHLLPFWVEYNMAWRLARRRIGKRASACDPDILSILMMAGGQGLSVIFEKIIFTIKIKRS
jgi:hypothetical protein